MATSAIRKGSMGYVDQASRECLVENNKCHSHGELGRSFESCSRVFRLVRGDDRKCGC